MAHKKCMNLTPFVRMVWLAILLVCAGESVAAADKFAGIPVAVQPFVDQGEISGAVMLVATKDRVLHLSAVGTSDLATGRKLETGDYFWIASMTKPLTAVCVALLVDDGKLSFDDPLEKFLPEFRNLWVVSEQTADRRVLVKAARPITLRDVLTHTSGLGDYTVTGTHWTSAEFARVLSREPLRFQPGARWAYSTAGIDALGHVVEVVSGKTFAEFMQARLFEPLGMTHSTFWLSAEQEKNFAHNYRMNAQTNKLAETTIAYLYGGSVSDRARPALGGAGLFSTAEDVAKVYQMMLSGGELAGHRVLKPETVAEMTRKQTGDLKARAGMPWGLGFSIIEDPTQMEANAAYAPGSFGHGGAHGTQSWADPKSGLVHVFMIQRAGIPNNPDNSPMRRAYEAALAAAVAAP